MPTYEYQCQQCAAPFEVRQSIAQYSEGKTTSCPRCGSSDVVRRISPVSVAVGDRSDGGPAPSCDGGSCCCG